MQQTAVILGLGTFGGGLGATKHLARSGHRVLVTDLRSSSELEVPLRDLRPELTQGSVTTRLGVNDPDDAAACDLLVVSPAIKRPWEHPCVIAARDAGARVTTEIALALDALPERCPRVGVTGSAGKSTTSALIHAGLVAAGATAHLGGNIGGSLLDRLGSINTDGNVVVELSSAQLWWLSQPGAMDSARWFDVAVVTNLAENHLDWHGTLDHYAASKHVLTQRLRSRDTAVLGETAADFPTAARRVTPAPHDPLPPLKLQGDHNRSNARLGLAACTALGVSPDKAATGIAAFRGLPHRLELVRHHRGIRYVNDSKSTTPNATRLALEAFNGDPVHLIVGGSDKGTSLEPLAELASATRSLLCIGATGATIATAACAAGADDAGTLETALAMAHDRAAPGDVVLLSPGCASFDQFRNFEHRGERFVELVHSLP
ncbi:MAG: UDP-N-acetylmuramoyl-L-alanine--D-glutamate ligase [Planctomycetota bacterium]